MKVNVWVSDTANLPILAVAQTDEQRLRIVDFVRSDIDMTSAQWTRVGTAEVRLMLDDHGAIEVAAVKSIDAAIEKIKGEFALRIQELQEARASLLSLPATVEERE